MSFSSIVVAWPFLLGVEAGTVPLGSDVKYSLASAAGTSLCSMSVDNFLPLMDDTKVNNIIKKMENTRVFRAIEGVIVFTIHSQLYLDVIKNFEI